MPASKHDASRIPLAMVTLSKQFGNVHTCRPTHRKHESQLVASVMLLMSAQHGGSSSSSNNGVTSSMMDCIALGNAS